MTTGDFDFFGAPSTPPPTGPPAASQFGAPAVSQFGTPAVSQFGTPGAAPARPAPAPPSGTDLPLGLIAGGVVALVLGVGGFVWLQGQGTKTANKVATTVETPIVKAHQTVETMDLQQARQAEETYLAEHSAYATDVSALTGFVPSPNVTVSVVSATATGYCLRADDSSTLHAPSMYFSSAGGSSKTPCT